MGGAAAGLHSALVVTGHVHDHGTLLHQLQILAVDDVILPVLCPLDTIDDHIGLPQALFQIGPVGDHEAHIGQMLLSFQHHVHVHVKDPYFVAEAAGQLGHAYADIAAAQTGDDGALHTGYIGQQLAGAAVHGLHIVQRRQKTSLTG